MEGLYNDYSIRQAFRNTKCLRLVAKFNGISFLAAHNLQFIQSNPRWAVDFHEFHPSRELSSVSSNAAHGTYFDHLNFVETTCIRKLVKIKYCVMHIFCDTRNLYHNFIHEYQRLDTLK